MKEFKTISDPVFDYIKYRQCHTYISLHPQNHDIKEAVLNHSLKMIKKPIEGKKDKHEQFIKLDKESKRLSLQYYQMPLL